LHKLKIKIITLIILFQILITGLFIVINSKADPISIQAQYGNPPKIDGIIDAADNEWDNAVKERLYLYRNLSDPKNGLPIDLWILQTEHNLFISIQFELEEHNSHEFSGVLISDSDSTNQENFIDAKIVQFNNISSGEYLYTDFYITNDIFYIDSIQDGNGAAKLNLNKVIYELSLPIKKNETNTEDSYLNFGRSSQKAFKIVFGTSEIAYNGFLVQNDVFIELQFPPFIPSLSITEILLLTFNIIIFGGIGGFYIYYVYKLTQLKKKINRIKR
jgi:hypothetical protein